MPDAEADFYNGGRTPPTNSGNGFSGALDALLGTGASVGAYFLDRLALNKAMQDNARYGQQFQTPGNYQPSSGYYQGPGVGSGAMPYNQLIVAGVILLAGFLIYKKL
jgi:hypothetical protein